MSLKTLAHSIDLHHYDDACQERGIAICRPHATGAQSKSQIPQTGAKGAPEELAKSDLGKLGFRWLIGLARVQARLVASLQRRERYYSADVEAGGAGGDVDGQ